MIADSQIVGLSLRITIPPGRDAPVGGSRSYHSEVESSMIVYDATLQPDQGSLIDHRQATYVPTNFSGSRRVAGSFVF
ncbi:hypothetical protein PQR46_35225 [Paraburkholderia sediminicola]|uniref:hypothetical protein n=1 Tax=Paraburkholderia TaxID=1822464 RepID=UPI0038B80EA0